ncbi:hypothetical protein C7S16_0282 [Burkholderia thailandensis]|uniref:Uncharacterized protein n=1 Tax=Burkholderia thailandensis TaxID=57975 RepID=A0AAW9D610_BURTH|nr:hypothetical protein [Burkholderia thailandensis]MDW9257212.1 hypothetical protein [Burkholderia thailandensis]
MIVDFRLPAGPRACGPVQARTPPFATARHRIEESEKAHVRWDKRPYP